MSSSYASPSPDRARENTIDNLCYESWVTQIQATLFGASAHQLIPSETARIWYRPLSALPGSLMARFG